MKVVIGGTFSQLHAGHLALLRKAFEMGDYVYIGLTKDSYAKSRKPGQKILSYAERKRKLVQVVKVLGKEFSIMPLSDRFGPSVTGDFDAIVVSEETYPIALKVNKIRKEKGLKLLKIVKIKYVLAEDSLPISSSRIASGEIDKYGKLHEKNKKVDSS
jgi:pantetheine-phosphate adenylyltransferase